MTDKKVVLYARVSTEDKDQNPDRQLMILREWAKRHGVWVADHFTDKGTSASKTNPLERPVFNSAVQAAMVEGAAILVTKVDRLTRQGTYELGWAITELKRMDPPVPVWVASKGSPEDQDREVIGALTDAIEAEHGAKYSRDLSEAVKSGMALAAKPVAEGGKGKHVGRPSKELKPKELELAKRLNAEGQGVRKIATAINRQRGLFERADVAKAIKKHGVSKSLVHQYLNGGRA